MFKKVLIGLLIIYVAGCSALYMLQDQFLFDPSKLSEDFEFWRGEEVEIEVDQSIFLNCLHLKEPRSQGVVLYLHGNRGSNRRCLRQAERFTGQGFDVFMPDYRGYGKSDGQLHSSRQMYRDMQKVYDYLRSIYREDQIIIAGYSIGTGMASFLAAQNDPAHLLLIAPYISIVNLKNRIFPLIPNFLLRFPFNNEKFLSTARCQTTLFHGTADRIIPFDSSEKLVTIDADRINLITLRGTSHRGSIFHNSIPNVISRIGG